MSASKDVMDALMRGMELEKETFDFYTSAEQRTFSQEGKRIFRWLAKTEEGHYLKLSELYNTLDQGGHWVFYGGCTVPLEPAGIAFFNELLQKTDDPAGRSMIETLRREEEDHLRIISERYQAIQK